MMVELSTRKIEIRGNKGIHHEKLGLKIIWCASQFTIPNTAGTCPNLACNNTDTPTSQPNQAGRHPDLSYPLVSSTSFLSSSLIPLFLVHNSTIIAEHNVMSSLYMSIPWSWVDTKYSIPHVQNTLSTAYTQYSIHRVQHPPRNVCLPVILLIGSWPLTEASASSVIPYTVNCLKGAFHKSSKVKSIVSFLWFRVDELMNRVSAPIEPSIHRLQEPVQFHSITAYKCISKLA